MLPVSKRAFDGHGLTTEVNSVLSGIIKVVCEDFPGVAVQRVDAACQEIHVRCVGNRATILQVEHAIHVLGFSMLIVFS